MTAVGDVHEPTGLAELGDDLVGQIVENLEIIAIHPKADGLRGSASRAWDAGTNLQTGETLTESLDLPCHLFD